MKWFNKKLRFYYQALHFLAWWQDQINFFGIWSKVKKKIRTLLGELWFLAAWFFRPKILAPLRFKLDSEWFQRHNQLLYRGRLLTFCSCRIGTFIFTLQNNAFFIWNAFFRSYFNRSGTILFMLCAFKLNLACHATTYSYFNSSIKRLLFVLKQKRELTLWESINCFTDSSLALSMTQPNIFANNCLILFMLRNIIVGLFVVHWTQQRKKCSSFFGLNHEVCCTSCISSS